jgi:hypothetical protein
MISSVDIQVTSSPEELARIAAALDELIEANPLLIASPFRWAGQ